MLKYILLFFLILMLFSARRRAKLHALGSSTPGKGIILLTFNGYMCEEENVGRNYWKPSFLLDCDRLEIISTLDKYFDKWDVVITTDDSLFYTYPENHRIRCVITSEVLREHNSEYGNRIGGISSFDGLAKGDTSANIISSFNLGNKPRDISDAIAHECGHSLGLDHFSLKRTLFNSPIKVGEYDVGDGEEAPIMGASYFARRAIWKTGVNASGAYQNDTLIISQTFQRLPNK